ncbi:hypothetical protein EWB00_005653 [Schistosoma japonicum]|uniref:Uncharacterized protein n=1 Tax=Schistosoma japonicum TaxID=6182 RepID=A0A4Z2DUU6_SCHJA|nr:hypothetical protein KSF78_0002419 [Schistosoma japonicum]TNN19980.1 hypothetical protein EWB00_005653 [Schistosoma japonicum]
MYRNHPVISNSPHSPQSSQPYYSRILLPKEPGNGPLNHSQRRHSLLNGSSSTSSERSKQSLVSAYFGRSRTLHRDSPSYMPTVFNFQPVNGYHSPVLKRRVCQTENTTTNLISNPVPPNPDITIQRGLRVFESKKRARELTDTTVSTEGSSQDGSDFGNTKRRKTSRMFDISTLGCTNEVDGFSFTSLRQLNSVNTVRVNVCPTDNRISSNINDQNSKSVQTQALNEYEDDRTPSTSSIDYVELTRNTNFGSAAALRRKIPYMSPSELEAHLRSTKALTYTSQHILENNASVTGDLDFIDLDTSPVQCSRKMVPDNRISTESDQITEHSIQSTFSSTRPSMVTNVSCYDEKSDTDNSELPAVQPTSLTRFIANLEGHSNLFVNKISQSQIKSTSFYRPSSGFDVESRVKRIRELISAKSSNNNSSSLCGYNTQSTITSTTSTSYFNPTTQIIASSNTTPVVSSTSSSLSNISSTSNINFMSVVTCSASALIQNITSVSNISPSTTVSKLFSFPVISSVSEVISTQTIISTSVAVTTVISLPGTTSFSFTPFKTSPSILVTSTDNLLATTITTVAFSLSTPTSTSHISVLKEPATISTIAVITSAPVSYSTFLSGAKLGVVSTSQSSSLAVPSSIFTFPTSTTTTSITMLTTVATTAVTQKTTVAFSFTFPPTSSTPSLSLQTTSSKLSLTENPTSSVFEFPKSSSTFTGFSFSKPAITSVCTSTSISPMAITNTVHSSSNKPFTFGSSNLQPVSTASLFTFGSLPVATCSLNPVSSINFGLTSAPSFLGSFSNTAPVSSSFVFGANLSKSSSTISSSVFVQSTVATTSSLSTVSSNSGLFTFTSPAASTCTPLFGSNSVNISSTAASLPTNSSFSGFTATGLNPLFTSVPKTFSTNSFTLGIKPANVTTVQTTSLFGASNQIFGTTTTSSVKFNFNQLTPSTASNVAITNSLSFGSTIGTTTATSVTPASTTLFQFGSSNPNLNSSIASVSQPFSFGLSVPQFSFGQQLTSVYSQPNTQPTISFSALNSGSATTLANAFQFSSTPLFSNINPSTNVGGFNFSFTQTSTPSVINPQANTGFIFGQTALSTGVNSNPFTFGTSSTGSSSSAPNAPRRRPLSSRRSRRP